METNKGARKPGQRYGRLATPQPGSCCLRMYDSVLLFLWRTLGEGHDTNTHSLGNQGTLFGST